MAYNVGGILLDRPFRIRRLGHFGLNLDDLDAGRRFYVDLLGFRVSDQAGMGGYFTRHNTEHHTLVLFDKKAVEGGNAGGGRGFVPGRTINQITWQVQSLKEVADATTYLRAKGVGIIQEGRAGGPGSNYHLYFHDVDGHVNELFYGMEQIGWDGHSKPAQMRHGLKTAPAEPQLPEHVEVAADLGRGLDPLSGHGPEPEPEPGYSVDGVLLPRPFKVVRIGPAKLFVEDVAAAAAYYTNVLGLYPTEEVEWRGGKGMFLRCGNEHHSLALFPLAWRDSLGLSPHTTCCSFGLQLATYAQLKGARDFLAERGVQVDTAALPPELHPGVDYCAYAFDPDGHCIELYYSMEQVGWDGRPRPRELRRTVDPHAWPESLDPMSDTYSGEVFLGPWA